MEALRFGTFGCILTLLMTLDILLRRNSLFALPAQMSEDEPRPSGMKRKIHWVGQKPQVEPKQESRGKRNERPPKKKDARGYRELSTITLGEVDDAHRYYANQLVASPAPAWIAPDYFCMIHLRPRRDVRPPALFGRVKTCYPGDGYLQNIQELEFRLPCRERAPDVVHLQAADILHTQDRMLQSYCARVRFLVTPDERAEFADHERLFLGRGYLPEFNMAYIDLLDLHEHNRTSLPWLYVIGSRWFASIPVSMQPEVREKLSKLIQWNKLLFNYHPEHLPREVRTLNRELGFKPGFTDTFLIEPENPEQTVQIVATTFDRLFSQPMKE